ncbi:MFS general substrate transporter [Crassisporium funariophilum]|nr:MFS general substrate transporter [Crassisporium funariophilum]
MDHKDSTDAEKGISSPTSSTPRDSAINVKCEEVDLVKDDERDLVPSATAFPDGGLQAWLTVLGAFLVQYTSFGYINAFGVYQDFYVREYLTDFSPSAIGWIGGVQIFLNFSMGVFTGRAFDRGYFYHLMTASVVLHAVAVFMLSLSHQNSYYQVFLTNGVALGLSSGLSYVPCNQCSLLLNGYNTEKNAALGIAGHYFQKRRSLAIGIISSGSALGAVIHPIMLNKLFNGPVGFQNGVRISGALNVFLLVIAAFVIRPRLPPKASHHRFPIWQWMKEPAYLACIVGGIFCFLGLFFAVFYLQLYAIQHGVDTNFAFYALSILNAASIFGRTIPGSLSPKFGVFNLGAIFTIATGVVILCLVAVKDAAGTAIFAVFFGLFSGACIALTPAMIGNLAKDMSEIGTRLGIYFGIGGVFGLFATPISGALLTSHYHWINPSLFAGIAMVLGGVFYSVCRHYVAKQRGTHRV